jgi:Pyridoxamine 5'-phosphate oxidase
MKGRQMNPQDVASELNHPGAQELLASAAVARLAYTGKDGFPRVIPVAFHWNGEAVVVGTPPAAPKVAAMSAQPRVALTIDTDTMPPRSLLIRGLAAIQTLDGVCGDFVKANTKGMEQAQVQGFEAQARATYKQMSRIAITPDWARFYDFGADRVPSSLLKLRNDA